MAHTQAVQTLTDSQDSVRVPAQSSHSLSPAERRVVFRQAIAKGKSTSEAGLLAGISEATAYRWAKHADRQIAKSEADGRSIANKVESAAILSQIARNDAEASAYRVNAISTLSKIMGYDAPTRSEQIVVHASVAQWIDARNELPAAPAKALTQSTEAGTPPNQTRADSLSHSQYFQE